MDSRGSMSVSVYLKNLIHCNQNLIQNERFSRQAAFCFAEPEQGFVDILIDSPKKKATENYESENTVKRESTAQEFNLVQAEKNAQHPASTRVKAVEELRNLLCRVKLGRQIIFVRQRNSRSRLSVSRNMFEVICEERKIFGKLKNVVVLFGIRSSDVYALPPAPCFNWQNQDVKASDKPVFLDFELVYTLRLVEDNQRLEGIRWSLRQCGIYHKAQLSIDSSTWLFLALTPSLEANLNNYLRQVPVESMHTAFEIHYVLFDAALTGWSDCVTYIAEEVQKQSDAVFMAEIEVHEATFTQLDERQYLKKLEDFVVDLLSAIDHMLVNALGIDDSLTKYHSRITQVHDIKSSSERTSDFEILRSAFLRRQQDALQYRKQLTAVQQKIQSVSTLVSNILDLSNGEALKLLAVETKIENARTAILTQKSVEDAATVKVLTIITLVYLPLTVVTNFFSTSFVNSQPSTTSSGSITVTSDVWILFVVGVPLTLFTIYLWWVFSHKEVKGIYPGHISRAKKHIVRRLPDT